MGKKTEPTMDTHIVIVDHGDHLSFTATQTKTGDTFTGGEHYHGMFGEDECGEAYKGRIERANALGRIVASVFIVYGPTSKSITIEVLDG